MDRLVTLFSVLGSNSEILLKALRVIQSVRAQSITIKISSEERVFIHDIIVVEFENKYYYFESNWLGLMRGVNGPFDSLFSLLGFVRKTYETTLAWRYAGEEFTFVIV